MKIPTSYVQSPLEHLHRNNKNIDKIVNLRLLIATIFVGLSTCCFTSCAWMFDPRQKALEPHVETNPSPQAIVGFWHHKHPTEPNTALSILFRSNGTGVKKRIGSDPFSFTYVYEGNGEWRLNSLNGNRYICKIANGKLLEYAPAGNAFVYDPA